MQRSLNEGITLACSDREVIGKRGVVWVVKNQKCHGKECYLYSKSQEDLTRSG